MSLSTKNMVVSCVYCSLAWTEEELAAGYGRCFLWLNFIQEESSCWAPGLLWSTKRVGKWKGSLQKHVPKPNSNADLPTAGWFNSSVGLNTNTQMRVDGRSMAKKGPNSRAGTGGVSASAPTEVRWLGVWARAEAPRKMEICPKFAPFVTP